MRIVYDKTQTMEKGLAGWSEPLFVFPEKKSISASEKALWQCLAPGHSSPEMQTTQSKDFRGFWDQLYLVEKAPDSQYDVLRNFQSNSSHRLACVALSGEGFHGQRKRPWQALSGNLHLSVSVPLDSPSGPDSLAWTMLPAVSIMKTLKILEFPEIYGIKWVNDVFCESQKLAGVISALAISEGRINRGFLGIGLNVAQNPTLTHDTCCLHQLQNSIKTPLGQVLQVILASLAELITLYEDGRTDLIFQDYRANSLVVGRQVCIMTDPTDGKSEEICRGKVLGMNPDLSLNIEGEDDPIHHGRLNFL